MASWKIKCQLCAIFRSKGVHMQEPRCHGDTEGSPSPRPQSCQQSDELIVHLTAHYTSWHGQHLCHSYPPRQNHHDEIIIFFFFFLITVLTADMLGLMLSGKLSPWKRKRESPQISVESLPRTVNIFGSPRRTNAFWRLAESAVLKRE